MNEDSIPLASRAAERQLTCKRARACSVDRLAVRLHPAADLSQPVYARLRDQPFGGRSDVQQIVSALRCDVDEISNERPGGLPMVVIELVAPRVVHCHATLPIDSR